MLQMVLKDLQVQRREKTFFIVLFLSVCISGILPRNPGLASVQLLLGVYLMIVYANAFDYKYNAEIMINSLPLGRRQIVTAKYLSALIFSLIMVAVSIPVSFILSYFGFPGAYGMNLVIAIRFLMIAFFFLSIYIAIFFPVYFKLGYMKSRWANFLSFFVIFGLIGLAGGTGQYIPQHGELMSRESLMQNFLGILAGNESFGVYVSMLLIGILVLYISLQLSIAIYKRKEF